MQLPTISLTNVTDYLAGCEKILEDTAKNLYDERYFKTARLATDYNKYYVHALCKAQMKKHVTYNVDVLIDSNTVITECQCECAAGMGPTAHCKHICALLYGLYFFSQTKEFLLEETCTKQVQSFNKCKKFKGSPLKSSSIKLRKKQHHSCIFQPTNVDPRPISMRKLPSYPAYFKNACLNFSHEAPNMPILQIIPPANIYAVSNDHDYLLRSPAETCLHNLLESEQPYQIELKTRSQGQNKMWFDERCKRMQLSFFGRICKCTE